jgi:hypothetical protein
MTLLLSTPQRRVPAWAIAGVAGVVMLGVLIGWDLIPYFMVGIALALCIQSIWPLKMRYGVAILTIGTLAGAAVALALNPSLLYLITGGLATLTVGILYPRSIRRRVILSLILVLLVAAAYLLKNFEFYLWVLSAAAWACFILTATTTRKWWLIAGFAAFGATATFLLTLAFADPATWVISITGSTFGGLCVHWGEAALKKPNITA